MVRLKLAETLGKSFTWIQQNITVKELMLWVVYWKYKDKKENGVPTKKASTEEQLKQVNRIAKAFGTTVVTRERGT